MNSIDDLTQPSTQPEGLSSLACYSQRSPSEDSLAADDRRVLVPVGRRLTALTPCVTPFLGARRRTPFGANAGRPRRTPSLCDRLHRIRNGRHRTTANLLIPASKTAEGNLVRVRALSGQWWRRLATNPSGACTSRDRWLYLSGCSNQVLKRWKDRIMIFAVFAGVAVVGLVASFAVERLLHIHLRRVLTDICETDARSGFFVAVSALAIVLTGALASTATTGYNDSSTGGFDVLGGALTQFRFVLVGLLGIVLIIALFLVNAIRRYESRHQPLPPSTPWAPLPPTSPVTGEQAG